MSLTTNAGLAIFILITTIAIGLTLMLKYKDPTKLNVTSSELNQMYAAGLAAIATAGLVEDGPNVTSLDTKLSKVKKIQEEKYAYGTLNLNDLESLAKQVKNSA